MKKVVMVFGAGIYHVDDEGRLLAAPLRLRGLPGEAGPQQGFCHMASRSGSPLTVTIMKSSRTPIMQVDVNR